MNILKNILRWMGYDIQDDSMEAISARYEEQQQQEELEWERRLKSV